MERIMVRTETRRDGAHLRIVIDEPKGNIVSIAVLRAVRAALAGVAQTPHVKLVTIEGAGDHFSYGASVEEHLPGVIGDALVELHGLVRDLLNTPAPTAALVRGRCLGGGFEIALACDLIFAGTTAMLGVPEITLGVFPPAAAALLPRRIGPTRAASAILSGHVWPVEHWKNAGLIELVAPSQELSAAVDHWFNAQLATKSAAALRHATRACRTALRKEVESLLPELERQYLESLMQTHDAVEGLQAFLDKRQPVWSDA
jgi:cyclohexa-1,5-dienecarbonyl-CoA hydratase